MTKISRLGIPSMMDLKRDFSFLEYWRNFFVLLVILKQCSSSALQSVGVKNTLMEVPGLGNRPVKIRFYPGVENIQSDLYEVYAEPYAYDLQAHVAIAVLSGEGESEVRGEIMFIQHQPPAGPTIVRGNVTGLPAGKHGLHIHRSGDLRNGCDKLGEHFNPFHLRHGAPIDPIRHVGDLGNIEAGDDGTAEINVLDPILSLSLGHRGIVGRALVVTTYADDLGRGGTADSLLNGQAGAPLACGVIAYIR